MARWQPWARGAPDAGVSPPWASKERSAALSKLWAAPANQDLAGETVVELAPPGARRRLQRLCCGERHVHHLVWQLDGEVECALFPPEASGVLGRGPHEPPLFDANLSMVDPWRDPPQAPAHVRVVLRRGDVLLVPAGWWFASLSLSPSCALRRPWVSRCCLGEFDAARRRLAEAREGLLASAPSRSEYDEFRARLGEGAPGWHKRTLRPGRPNGPPNPWTFYAVVHMRAFSEDSEKTQDSRLQPGAPPRLLLVSRQSAPLLDVLRSMAPGEVAEAVMEELT